MNLSSPRLLVELPPAALESLGRSAARPAWEAAPLPVASGHPWDQAHRAVRNPAAVGLESAAPAYAEPDFVQVFPFPRADGGGLEAAPRSPCDPGGPDDFWPLAAPAVGWHLDAGHSQLGAARDRAGDPGDGRRIRVAHLDTGYDPDHHTRPRHLRPDLGRNFAGGDPADTTDPGRHFPMNNPGHGTATLAILAGGGTAGRRTPRWCRCGSPTRPSTSPPRPWPPASTTRWTPGARC